MRHWAVAAFLGCASYTTLAPEDRRSVEREVSAEGERYLRLSYFVTPFFGDSTKRLLTALPPDEVRMVNQPNGEPVNPGAVEKILPAGTRAKILKVEFPTAWTVAERVAYTPRYQPWLYVGVEGEPKEPPLILVLRPNLQTEGAFLAEVDKYLSKVSLDAMTDQWAESVKTAVRTKAAVLDMPADALETSWGYPELKRLTFDATGSKREAWIYPGGKRTVHLVDGRVSSIDQPQEK